MKYISHEEYTKAKEIVRVYELLNIRQVGDDENDDNIDLACPTCGEIDGVVNKCCVGYDPLHYKNCGHG